MLDWLTKTEGDSTPGGVTRSGASMARSSPVECRRLYFLDPLRRCLLPELLLLLAPLLRRPELLPPVHHHTRKRDIFVCCKRIIQPVHELGTPGTVTWKISHWDYRSSVTPNVMSIKLHAAGDTKPVVHGRSRYVYIEGNARTLSSVSASTIACIHNMAIPLASAQNVVYRVGY